ADVVGGEAGGRLETEEAASDDDGVPCFPGLRSDALRVASGAELMDVLLPRTGDRRLDRTRPRGEDEPVVRTLAPVSVEDGATAASASGGAVLPRARRPPSTRADARSGRRPR